LIANFSSIERDIDKRKTVLSTTISPVLGRKKLANFGSQAPAIVRQCARCVAYANAEPGGQKHAVVVIL